MDRAGLLFMQHERCRGEASGTTQPVAATGGDGSTTRKQPARFLQNGKLKQLPTF